MKLLFILMFMSSPVQAEKVSVKFTAKDLQVAGEFSSPLGQPIRITGFDMIGKPYVLELKTAAQPERIVQVAYTIERDGKTHGGSIVTQKGQTSKLSIQGEQTLANATLETLIIE